MLGNDNERNSSGAIGIGAMIVFIALILVAAVASAVIIQTAEKLQQNAQATGDDTQAEIAGKISVIDVFVTDGGNTYLEFVLVFQLAPGSGSVLDTAINWQTFCLDAGGAFDQDDGNFDDDVISNMDTSAASAATAATALTAGNKYYITIGGTAALGGCEPGVVNAGNIAAPPTNEGTIDMYIHVNGGGTTYTQLDVSGTLADGTSIL